MTGTAGGPTWDKPGKGAWAHDGAHDLAPATRLMQELFPSAMADGFRSFTGRYGMPISHIDVRYVNGFAYGSVQIAGVGPSDRPPPPALVLRALTRIHPEMRRRNRRALAAFERRLWHDDLRRWFDELRPARLDLVRSMQAVETDQMDATELAAHVVACVDGLRDGLREHFSLVGASGLPVGVLLLRETERGRSADDVLADLGGAAARSTAATLPALRSVAEALARAGVRPASLDEARAASPAAALSLDAYLAEYGERVVGAFDVTGRRLVELPDVVLRSIATSSSTTTVATTRPATAIEATCDPVVDDALLAVEARDDHAGISCMWPLGLARRALLAAGHRLHEHRRVHHPDHILEAGLAEVVALLRDEGGAPTADELDRRATERRALASFDPPAVLGEAHPSPDPSLFPSGLRRAAEAMGAFLAAMDGNTGRDASSDRPASLGIGSRPHRARAVVAADPEDAAARLEPGDVLVTATTTPAFNSVLPIAGALVTVHGGAMSHAGIAARELGLPAVIGLADALTRIVDGEVVVVDPVSATVATAEPYVAFGGGAATPTVMTSEVGAKAAGLIEMAHLGLPVPPGVVLPISILHRHRAEGVRRNGLDAVVRAALTRLEELTELRLGDPTRPLVVSVRSGADASMPGMLDTVLDVGATPEVVEAIAQANDDPAFAEDTRRRFLLGYAAVVGGLGEDEVDRLAHTPIDDLEEALAVLGRAMPSDPVEQLVAAVGAVVSSWDGERARTFRRRDGVDDAAGTAVTIQQMAFGNLGHDSGTGVVFSRDPATGAPGTTGEVLIGAQGEDVVGGRHQALPSSEVAVRWPAVDLELEEAVVLLEQNVGDMVDIEFTVEQGHLHLLQCRPGRRSPAAALRIAVAMAEDPHFPLDRSGAVARCRNQLARTPTDPEPLPEEVVTAHLVTSGTAASPGRGVGHLSVSVEDALRRHERGEPVVVVRPHTTPADVAALGIAQGIVTASGGRMSHAAVVARSWGVPAVTSATELTIDEDGIRVGDRRVDAGSLVTVDGSSGILLAGDHRGEGQEPAEARVLRSWAAALDGSGGSPGPVEATDAARARPIDDGDVLRLVVMRGRADVASLATALGTSSSVVAGAVGRLRAGGVVVERGDVVATAAGRDVVSGERAELAARVGPAFALLLVRFRGPDRALKAIVTAAQGATRPGGTVDVDTATATACRRLRGEVHPEATVVIADARGLVPRLGRYQERLDLALARLEAGDRRHLAHPSVDSYHGVWFELHDEILALAGTDRATEEAVADRT